MYPPAGTEPAGINYFDTARDYGNGQSETNLGQVLAELKPEAYVGTKLRLMAEEMGQIGSAVTASVEGSLKRLQLDCVELIQLHNPIALQRRPERDWVGVEDVPAIIEAFEGLQQAGKIRHWGITGLGETAALHQVVATGQIETIQCCFNLLNPSAGVPVSPDFPFQDYEQLIDAAARQRVGVIVIRALAAGALSGSTARHPNAAQTVDPISSGGALAEDVALAQRFNYLVEDGYASSLVEAAFRFVISKPEVSTALVGISNMEQLEQAIAAAQQGPLPAEALDRLKPIWAGYAQ